MKIAISGGPCCGKSSVIDVLDDLGYITIKEQARELKKQGFVAENDPVLFENLLLAKQYNLESITSSEPVFIDGGHVDMYAFCKYFGVYDNVYKYKFDRYNTFFVLDRLQDYVQDSERNQTRHEAETLHKYIIQEAIDRKYNIIYVPNMTVKERVEFILKKIKKN